MKKVKKVKESLGKSSRKSPAVKFPPSVGKDLLFKTSSFFNESASCSKAAVVLLGIPMDYTASNIPGSRFAPKRIRELPYTFQSSSPVGADCIDGKFCDLGDIVLPWGNIDKSLKFIDEVVKGPISAGKKIVGIGGDHLVTLPIVECYAEKYKDLAVVQFDAHTDLRDEWSSENTSHARLLRRACEVISEGNKGGKGNLYQFAIRAGSKEEDGLAERDRH